MSVNAHRSVAHIATEMAQAVYEECAKDNFWHFMNRDRAAWVRAAAPQFIGNARETLAELLTKDNVSDKEKEEIYDILLQDNSIPRTGTSVAQ